MLTAYTVLGLAAAALILLVMLRRGFAAKVSLQNPEENYRHTTISRFVDANIDRGPKWLRFFRTFVATSTIGGSVVGIWCGFGAVFFALRSVGPGEHNLGSVAVFAVGFVYLTYFHPTVMGLLFDAVFGHYIPGYKAELEAWKSSDDK